MTYVEDLPDNEKEHEAFHDRVVKGVPGKPLKTDRMIWQESDKRITVVTAFSHISQRNRAEAAASLANLGTRYDGGIYQAAEKPDERDIHIFLYHARNRIVGLIILEKRSTVWRCRWGESDPPACEELRGHEPMRSVVFIWVNTKHRKSGIARVLFLHAVKHLGLSREEVGWYTPFSDDGRAFAKSLYPDEFYVAK
jgi:hypothetical protein